MPALPVHINRDRPREIDAPASFVADGPFDVAVENHGGGSHVHVQLDGSLSGVARVRDGSTYVGRGGISHVRVDTQSLDEPTTGTLTVSLGYGAEEAAVELRVEPSRESGYGLEIDEDLANPQVERDEPVDAETVALLALAGVALLAAGAVAVTIQSTAVVAAAALVALITVVGVVAALA